MKNLPRVVGLGSRQAKAGSTNLKNIITINTIYMIKFTCDFSLLWFHYLSQHRNYILTSLPQTAQLSTLAPPTQLNYIILTADETKLSILPVQP